MAVYTKEMLEATSIFAIRDIAKEVGISSPTKKNKAELIDLILKISSGEMAPPKRPAADVPKNRRKSRARKRKRRTLPQRARHSTNRVRTAMLSATCKNRAKRAKRLAFTRNADAKNPTR